MYFKCLIKNSHQPQHLKVRLLFGLAKFVVIFEARFSFKEFFYISIQANYQLILLILFEWEPPNEKPRLDRPKITWKHTLERDLKTVEQSWESARMVAQYRYGWLKVMLTQLLPVAPKWCLVPKIDR